MHLIKTFLFSLIFVLKLETLPSLPVLVPEVEEILQSSKTIRVQTHQSLKVEKTRQERLLESIISRIPDYGDHETLEHACSLLLSEKTCFKNYAVINSKFTDFSGKSHDEVFFVQDSTGAMKYVIKAFHDPETRSGKFLPELSAMALLIELKMHTLKCVDPLAFGKCRWRGKSYALLIESVAPGIRVDRFFESIALYPAGSFERANQLEKAIGMCECIGQSLAELHERSGNSTITLAKEILRKADQTFKAFLEPKIMGLLQERINLSDLSKFFRDLSQEISWISFVACYQHMDLNLNNIFYDEDKQIVTFIDVSRLHKSIDYDGNPIADGVNDLIRVKESLVHHMIGFLSESEISLLTEALFRKRNYTQEIFDERLAFYYSLTIKMTKMITYSDFPEIEDAFTRERHQMVFERNLQFLQDILQPVFVAD